MNIPISCLRCPSLVLYKEGEQVKSICIIEYLIDREEPFSSPIIRVELGI